MVKVYKKIKKLMDVLSYFSLREFNFSNKNVQTLWTKLNDTDKQLFEFNMDLFDFEADTQSYIEGLRIYLLKDPLETVPAGIRKYKKLRIAHYTVVTLVSLLLFKLLWTILSTFYNIFY